MNETLRLNALYLCVFGVACLILFPGLTTIETLVFDETHYVPAARAILDLSVNNNTEHPLFAKEMIAAGIAVFGDNAFGWRFPGVLLSALGMVACFEIARRLFGSVSYALFTCVLLLTNIMFVVQARTAMLDTYTYPLLAISIALFMVAGDKKRGVISASLLLVLSGTILGLAAGAKWIAGIYAFIALIGLVFQRIGRTFADGRSILAALFGGSFQSFPRLSLISAGLLFGIPSLIAYFATFLPALYWSQGPLDGLAGIIEFQFTMLDRQTMPLADNAYERDWWSWPVMLEPIWYEFKTIEEGGHRAIFYVGNPVMYWTGCIVLLVTLGEGIRRQSGMAVRTSLAFLASWLIFAVLPKQIGFLFYYHGSAMIMCFVIASGVQLLPKGRFRSVVFWGFPALCAVTFLYFLPIIYAVEMPRHQWLQYIWLKSWT